MSTPPWSFVTGRGQKISVNALENKYYSNPPCIFVYTCQTPPVNIVTGRVENSKQIPVHALEQKEWLNYIIKCRLLEYKKS